jgi:signal transduction histidine kinase
MTWITLGAFCGAVWSKQRENPVYLLFSCSAAAAAVISAFELWMMRAWLAWSIYSLRTLIQILNFSFSSSISAPVSAQRYRIAQEAVRNAIEHDAACQVLIQLTFGDRSMMLTVQDDGQGFDTKSNGHGMGLRIVRYRARCIGSSCEVHAGPTQGTIVHCRVPLEAQHSVSTIS